MLDDQFEQEERWRDLRSEKWFNALAYVWRVGVNIIFYILVVLYVFSRLYERFEVIVVALFGVLYVTIRTIGNGLVMFNSQFGIALDKELDAIKRLLDASHRRDKAEFNKAERRSGRRPRRRDRPRTGSTSIQRPVS